MTSVVLARRDRIWWFTGLAAAVYAAVLFVTRVHTGWAHPGAVGLAAACDLMITVPALYYLLLVRPGHSSWSGLIAAFLAGARVAAFLLPASAQAHLPSLRWVIAPLELWAVATVGRRLRQSPSARGVIATEIQILYYALFAWRARPQAEPGAQAFGAVEASGYRMFSGLLITAVIAEGVPLHLLLQRWSHTAAWICTAAGVYSLLWLVAMYRSIALRPFLVRSDSVLLQVGFVWRAEFRRDQIHAMRRISAAEKGCPSLVVINEPQWLIEFSEPVDLHGLFGRRKHVTRIALAVDDPAGFAAAMNL